MNLIAKRNSPECKMLVFDIVKKSAKVSRPTSHEPNFTYGGALLRDHGHGKLGLNKVEKALVRS